jgi:ACT domain-containing protein
VNSVPVVVVNPQEEKSANVVPVVNPQEEKSANVVPVVNPQEEKSANVVPVVNPQEEKSANVENISIVSESIVNTNHEQRMDEIKVCKTFSNSLNFLTFFSNRAKQATNSSGRNRN